MSHRERGTTREPARSPAPRRDRRRSAERSATREQLADRIAAEYGVDRDRAVAGAELYMRQLRRGFARTGY